MEPSETEEPSDGRPLRFGRRNADGSVRFVVRPIQWSWVIGVSVVGLAFSAYFIVSDGAPWYILAIFLALPFFMTWHEGFDVRPRETEIYGWKALGPIPYGTFTLRHLKLPDVRSSIETHTSSDGTESRARVTRLWWGNRNLRVGMKRGELDALLDEAETVGLTPMKGKAARKR